MTADTYLTAGEARAFVAANPSVEWIDVFMFDLNGVARGKRFRPADLPALADKGILVPSTVSCLWRQKRTSRHGAGRGRWRP